MACDLAETGWQDVTLAGCALAGVQAFSASMRRVTFRDCKLDSVNFRSATLTDVRFEDCLLRDAEFGGAKLLRVSFGGCTLARADFTKVSCTEVDLRGAALGITAGYESLRGATIDSVQLIALAPLLARHLGITVIDALLPARPGPGHHRGYGQYADRCAPGIGGPSGSGSRWPGPGARLRQRGADPAPAGRRAPGHRHRRLARPAGAGPRGPG